MGTHVVLLRGINVGGNRRIPMAALRKVLERAGLRDPVTLLQSGNVIVDSPAGTSSLTDIVETTIETEFGFHSDAIVRTGDEFNSIVETHPFLDEQLDDARMAQVVFLKSAPPSDDGYSDLRAQHEGPETVTLAGREVFIHYPDGSGRSRLSGKAIEAALGVPGTARNWNTVLKIQRALVDNG